MVGVETIGASNFPGWEVDKVRLNGDVSSSVPLISCR